MLFRCNVNSSSFTGSLIRWRPIRAAPPAIVCKRLFIRSKCSWGDCDVIICAATACTSSIWSSHVAQNLPATLSVSAGQRLAKNYGAGSIHTTRDVKERFSEQEVDSAPSICARSCAGKAITFTRFSKVASSMPVVLVCTASLHDDLAKSTGTEIAGCSVKICARRMFLRATVKHKSPNTKRPLDFCGSQPHTKSTGTGTK